jgi:hypothetical protein
MQPWWERVGWVVLIGLLLAVGCPIAIHRAIRNSGGTDFPEFYEAGRSVLEYRDILDPPAFLKYYWPSLDVAWAGLAWMPIPAAATVWYAISCASWFALLSACSRFILPEVESPRRRHVLLIAGLLMTPLVLDHVCLGAFHLMMLWLMVEGLGRASRGRAWSGGIFLGLAVWIKLLPLAGVGYLVYKRRFLPACIAVATAVIVDLTLCLPVYGPQRTWELHQKWYANQATGAKDRILDHPEVIDEDRLSNQSLPIVLRRLLTQLGSTELPGGQMPPVAERCMVAFGNLEPRQLRMVYFTVVGLLGLTILVFCRRSAASTTPAQWASEIALLAMATVYFSPVAWCYHHTAAFPILVVILGCWPQHPKIAWFTIVLWLLASILLGSELGRALGEMLWAELILGALLLFTSGRSPAITSTAHPAPTAV